MSEETPKGPDFRDGVPAADIAEGAMLGGRVGQDPVLIARIHGELHAIGSSCTHYHGALDEGLIVGETVRCPWHHACFSLKTGEAVGAPAFDPVDCWAVEETDGQVFVRSRRPASEPTKKPGGANKRVVIVGGGAGGFAAAELLRRRGFEGTVTMLSADQDPPYDRPNCSKDYLAGEAPAEWMPLRDETFYKTEKIDLRVKTTVDRIDVRAKTVDIRGGESQPYDILILATGSEPQRPAIEGLKDAAAFVMRTLRDADAVIKAAGTAKSAAVIGASFIALETAAALRQRGLTVHVIAPDTTPLAPIVGDAVGEWVKSVHEDKGVIFHLGRQVVRVQDGLLHLDQGAPVKADVLILGTGVAPRVSLAQNAGLKVDDGVVVDDHLRTSAEGVYAIGDIARYPNPLTGDLIRVSHWVHAQRQGQYLARQILGEDQPFSDPPYFWSNHYDKSISYSGHAAHFDPPLIDGSVTKEDATVSYSSAGKLLAVATVGRDLENLKAEASFEAV